MSCVSVLRLFGRGSQLTSGNGDFGSKLGRGETAVADMKARLAAMRNAGLDGSSILDNLWERHTKAVTGPGHIYDYAE